MSRPRKPYGSNPPGRLSATMIKVLAAEMSDQGRLARGKRYHADNAVLDIVVGHGAVTAEIQGSRSQPYVVTIEARQGSGVPGKREVVAHCTCPDDGLFDACKHAVAALFALSDEVAVEPELVDRWRRTASAPARPTNQTDDDADDDDDETTDDGRADQRYASNVVPIRRAHPPEPARLARAAIVDPTIEQFARLLAAPGGAFVPEFPEVTPIEHRGIADRQLADVLTDALRHLAIEWE